MLELDGKNVLMTGASGGIGQHLAAQLASAGCNLALNGRDAGKLSVLENSLAGHGSRIRVLEADIEDNQSCHLLVEQADDVLQGLDILINLAGVQDIQFLGNLTDRQINSQIAVNLVAPILLSRAVITAMRNRGGGRIVNIGSTFGTIGFAHYSVYSAAKFGLRGFSEALRRELCGTGIDVIYIAPRATRTQMNPASVYEIARETGMRIDEPADVAREIIKALQKKRINHYIGFPESLFAKLNSLMPGLVDKALYKQTRITRELLKS